MIQKLTFESRQHDKNLDPRVTELEIIGTD